MTSYKVLPQVTTATDIGVVYAANQIDVEDPPTFTFDPAPEYCVANLKTFPLSNREWSVEPVASFTFWGYNMWDSPSAVAALATLYDESDNIVQRDVQRTLVVSEVANPGQILVSSHGITDATINVLIEGHSGSTPSINGSYEATYIDANTFSIPVEITVAGTGGTVIFYDATCENVPMSIQHNYSAPTHGCGFDFLAPGTYHAELAFEKYETHFGYHDIGTSTADEIIIESSSVETYVDLPNSFHANLHTQGASGASFSSADFATAGGSVAVTHWFCAIHDAFDLDPPTVDPTGWTEGETKVLVFHDPTDIDDPITTTVGVVPAGWPIWEYHLGSGLTYPINVWQCFTWEYDSAHRYWGVHGTGGVSSPELTSLEYGFLATLTSQWWVV